MRRLGDLLWGLGALLLGLGAPGCASVEPAGGPVVPSFPSYNLSPLAPDASGMARTVHDVAAALDPGFNIGNTLEAIGGETAWGNPTISPAFLAAVRSAGFRSIRLPVSWDQFADPQTAQISPSWVARVKTVVTQALAADLSVVMNIHWDGGWLENHVTGADAPQVLPRQRAYWEQIATAFRDFDDRLLFAGANEPNVKTAAQMEVLLSYHQAFIDAVRSTGGRNTYRALVIQGPNTDIDLTHQLMHTLPTDPTPQKLLVEVHNYTPWNFTGMTQDESWGNQFYYWGAGNHSATDLAHNPTWGEEATIDQGYRTLKEQFVDQGIPVIIGEFGAQRRTNLTGAALALHLKSRVYYFHYLASRARAEGLVPYVWDTGSLLDRRTGAVLDQDILTGLLP